MHFPFNQDGDLLTPTIKDAGVNGVNPMLTSSDLFSLDDNDMHFPSMLTKESGYQLPSTNDNIDTDEERQQYDLLSTFDFPVLSELLAADVPMEEIDLQKYLIQTSTPDETILPWMGDECTVGSESEQANDMTVPPSPSISSESSFASTTKQRSTRKTHLTTIERKSRKKDQNKAAAEKYRKKKQAEKAELQARYTNLKGQNQELKMQLDSLSLRLESFKQLFVDLVQLPIPSNQTT